MAEFNTEYVMQEWLDRLWNLDGSILQNGSPYNRLRMMYIEQGIHDAHAAIMALSVLIAEQYAAVEHTHDDKVDRVAGKGLSENDLTNTLLGLLARKDLINTFSRRQVINQATEAIDLWLAGNPTGAKQIVFGSSGIISSIGTRWGGAEPIFVYNAYQPEQANKWTQNDATHKSFMLMLDHPTGILLYAAPAGQPDGDFETFWGSPMNIWHEGNDGAGSKLDAAYMDGIEGMYYRGISRGNSAEDANTTRYENVLTNVNTPTSTEYWHVRTQFYISDTSNRAQIAIQYNGNGHAVYSRHYISNVWTDWVRLDNADSNLVKKNEANTLYDILTSYGSFFRIKTNPSWGAWSRGLQWTDSLNNVLGYIYGYGATPSQLDEIIFDIGGVGGADVVLTSNDVSVGGEKLFRPGNYGPSVIIDASTTLNEAHLNKTITCSSASNIVLTVPSGLSLVGNPYINIINVGAGDVTIANGAGMAISFKDTFKRTIETNDWASLYFRSPLIASAVGPFVA